MIRTNIKLGRIAGVEFGLNWSWLLVFGLITWSLADSVFPSTNPGLGAGAYVAMGSVAAILFFASILLHELGHAVRARREGMEIDGITLWVFGGVAKFKGMFPSAGAEFRIAIAGPLVTLTIASVLILTAAALALPLAVDGVVVWLGNINFFLLAFNMLPALPLDGGRVFRSALWKWRGDFSWATTVAGALGRLFGQLMIAGGIALVILAGAYGGLWLAFIGWFLITAAEAESRLVAVRQALAGRRVADLMVRDPVTAPADLSIQRLVEESSRSSMRHQVYPVIDNGALIGLVELASVRALPTERWADVRVRDVMVPRERALVVGDHTRVADTRIAELAQTHAHRALVIDDGRLVGLLSLEDVAQEAAKRMQARSEARRVRLRRR